MEQKPKIYAHCDAGCRWEVPHMSDFLKSATYVEQYPDETGAFKLELGKEYRIFADKDENGEFVASLCLFVWIGDETNETAVNIEFENSDLYADSFVFKLLDFGNTVVYEVQGVRYSVTGDVVENYKDYATVTNANRVLLFNSDAQTVFDVDYNIPLEKGIGENSIQQVGSTAGVKGFYIKGIYRDTALHYIYLTNKPYAVGEKPIFTTDKAVAETWLDTDINTPYEASDSLFLFNGVGNYLGKAIRSVTNNKIIISRITSVNIETFTPHKEGEIQSFDYSIFTIEHPDGGEDAVPINNYAFATGVNSYAMGHCSWVNGDESKAIANYSYVEGYMNTSYMPSAHVEGSHNTSYGKQTHVEGAYNTAYALKSHIEGGNNSNTAAAESSHIEGQGNSVKAPYTHAEGLRNTIETNGKQAHIEGMDNVTNGLCTHVEGRYNYATGEYAHVEGYGVSKTVDRASGNYTHVEGYNTKASGMYGHAEGNDTSAANIAAHAEGANVTVSGQYSHGEGESVTVSGNAAHGQGRRVTVTGNQAHGEGMDNTASALCAHVGGRYSNANSEHSFVHGLGLNSTTDTSVKGQAVFGKYNAINANALFQVGNGTSDTARSNAFEVLSDGIKIGNTTITEAQLIKLLELIG